MFISSLNNLTRSCAQVLSRMVNGMETEMDTDTAVVDNGEVKKPVPPPESGLINGNYDLETQKIDISSGEGIENEYIQPCMEFPANRLATEEVLHTELKNNIADTVEDTVSAEGMPEVEATSSADNNGIVYFANQDAKITPSPVLQYVLDMEQPYDTVLSCSDGKLGCHRIVLASASPFIADAFGPDHRLGEIAVIILPDITVSIMNILLKFCYTGKMFFRKDQKDEVFEAMRFLLVGEFGKLTMKEVTVKLPPPEQEPAPLPGPAPIANNVEDRLEPVDEAPMPAEAWTAEALSYSTDEDDDKEDDEESVDEREEKYNPTYEAPQIPETGIEEEERVAFANSFMKNRKPTGDDSQTDIRYLIGQREVGTKNRKLWCNHCPAAFKSLDTLSDHLDNLHGLDLESRNLNKTELKKLTKCSLCTTRYPKVPRANRCITSHSSTRCYLCLELVKIKDFEEHVKAEHVVEQQKKVCVVKCRWCSAGILLHEPIDNKCISAHCFSQHVPGEKNEFPIDDDEKLAKPDVVELPEYLQQQKMQANEEIKSSALASIFAPRSKLIKNEVTSPRGMVVKGKDGKHTAPNASTSKSKKVPQPASSSKNGAPTVLAMLQQQSLKRKLSLESPAESVAPSPQQTQKRARLDSNGRPPQVAKRTGKPVGRLIDTTSLQVGAPIYTSKKDKQQNRCVTLDLTNLPRNYVKINYPKVFILEKMKKEDEFTSTSTNPESQSTNTGQTLSEEGKKCTVPDTKTSEESHDSENVSADKVSSNHI